ncbi:MAG TPA: potassium-transporting ATPase subunit KdpC [bacterium]|nr:potassium-transporting ATPase subunit KdpC [bacterium]
MRAQLLPAVTLTLMLTILTGLCYPLAITGIAQILFPHQANGSLIVDNGKVVGSQLIGQPFADPSHFWSRPSATSPQVYNAASSGGSNLGPTNQALVDQVKQNVAALRQADPGNTAPVPVDLVTNSASGLDPDISVAAALYQVPRVARVHKLPVETVRNLVAQYTEGRQFGILGEPRVNVLELNRALDQAK